MSGIESGETPYRERGPLDVSVEEIQADIDNEDYALAADKAQRRFFFIADVIFEDLDLIDYTEAVDYSKEEWEVQQVALIADMQDLFACMSVTEVREEIAPDLFIKAEEMIRRLEESEV